jgi:hypothetical protein
MKDEKGGLIAFLHPSSFRLHPSARPLHCQLNCENISHRPFPLITDKNKHRGIEKSRRQQTTPASKWQVCKKEGSKWSAEQHPGSVKV